MVPTNPAAQSPNAATPGARQLQQQLQSAERPLVMGVLNITPDSFSDGGRFTRPDQVLFTAEQMLADGADLLDIGGESTRPGAAAVSPEQEAERVLPVLEALSTRFDCPLSLDSSNAATIRAAAQFNLALVNDVRALTRDGALAAAVDSGALLSLMHMRGEPDTMGALTQYEDLIAEVSDYLLTRAQAACDAGARREQILLDPGFGFAKTTTQNWQMLSALHRLTGLGYPLLVGMSRKRMIGEATGRPVDQRAAGSAAAALIAAQQGAAMVRVHDVAATRDVLTIWSTVAAQDDQ